MAINGFKIEAYAQECDEQGKAIGPRIVHAERGVQIGLTYRLYCILPSRELRSLLRVQSRCLGLRVSVRTDEHGRVKANAQFCESPTGEQIACVAIQATQDAITTLRSYSWIIGLTQTPVAAPGTGSQGFMPKFRKPKPSPAKQGKASKVSDSQAQSLKEANEIARKPFRMPSKAYGTFQGHTLNNDQGSIHGGTYPSYASFGKGD